MPDQVRHDEGRAVTIWDRAVARLAAAEAALAAAAHTQDEDFYDRLGARHDRALERLLTAPAPHPAALADKIDLLVEHQAWELGFADSAWAALRRDARRFATRSS